MAVASGDSTTPDSVEETAPECGSPALSMTHGRRMYLSSPYGFRVGPEVSNVEELFGTKAPDGFTIDDQTKADN
jgi:hypothetical protein